MRNEASFIPQQQPRPWSTPRPWAGQQASTSGPWIGNSGATGSGGSGPTRKRSLTTALAHEKYLKKSISFVSLCLDNHRNIVVDSIISNVYVKIPDSSVSGQEILSAVATKVGCDVNELMMLDAKFVEITDDKGSSQECLHD